MTGDSEATIQDCMKGALSPLFEASFPSSCVTLMSGLTVLVTVCTVTSSRHPFGTYTLSLPLFSRCYSSRRFFLRITAADEVRLHSQFVGHTREVGFDVAQVGSGRKAVRLHWTFAGGRGPHCHRRAPRSHAGGGVSRRCKRTCVQSTFCVLASVLTRTCGT